MYGLAVSLKVGLAGVLFRELYLCLDWVGGDIFEDVDRVTNVSEDGVRIIVVVVYN